MYLSLKQAGLALYPTILPSPPTPPPPNPMPAFTPEMALPRYRDKQTIPGDYYNIALLSSSSSPVTLRRYVSAYLPGTIIDPMSSAEAQNRSRANFVINTSPVTSKTIAQAQTIYNQIKSFNADCKVGWYCCAQELLNTRSSGSFSANIYDFLQNNNRWAWNPTWHVGNPINGPDGAAYWACNETRNRLIGGMSVGDKWIDTTLNAMSLMNHSDLIMFDNSIPRPFSNYDWLENGASPSRGDPQTITAYITEYFERQANLAAQPNPQLMVYNGPVGWYNDYTQHGTDYRAQITGLGNVLIWEGVVGMYVSGGPISMGGMLFAPNPGTLGAGGPSQYFVYPTNGTVTATTPLGTPCSYASGGWMKNHNGSSIYNPALGSLNANSLRACFDFADDLTAGRTDVTNLTQFLGPQPSRFNDPFGPAPALWGGADKHVRANALLPIIYFDSDVHYEMMEQTPSRSSVMSDLDELRIWYGPPVAGALGAKQRNVDWGAGAGAGFQNGVYLRVFSYGATPNKTLINKRIVLVANPMYNGTQSITLPFPCRHLGASDLDGATPQAHANDGSFIGTALSLLENNGFVLIEN